MATKKKNPNETLFVIVFFGLVASAALTFLHTLPNLEDKNEAQEALTGAESRLDSAQDDLAELQSGGRDIQETIAIAVAADAYLPVAPPDGDATIQMRLRTATTFEQVARSLGQSIAGIDPQQATPEGVPDTLEALSVTTELTGPPDVLSRFVSALADQGVLVTVIGVTVEPAGDATAAAQDGSRRQADVAPPRGSVTAGGARTYTVDFLAWYSTEAKVALPGQNG